MTYWEQCPVLAQLPSFLTSQRLKAGQVLGTFHRQFIAFLCHWLPAGGSALSTELGRCPCLSLEASAPITGPAWWDLPWPIHNGHLHGCQEGNGGREEDTRDIFAKVSSLWPSSGWEPVTTLGVLASSKPWCRLQPDRLFLQMLAAFRHWQPLEVGAGKAWRNASKVQASTPT